MKLLKNLDGKLLVSNDDHDIRYLGDLDLRGADFLHVTAEGLYCAIAGRSIPASFSWSGNGKSLPAGGNPECWRLSAETESLSRVKPRETCGFTPSPPHRNPASKSSLQADMNEAALGPVSVRVEIRGRCQHLTPPRRVAGMSFMI